MGSSHSMRSTITLLNSKLGYSLWWRLIQLDEHGTVRHAEFMRGCGVFDRPQMVPSAAVVGRDNVADFLVAVFFKLSLTLPSRFCLIHRIGLF